MNYVASEIDGSPPCERTHPEQKSEAHPDEHTARVSFCGCSTNFIRPTVWLQLVHATFFWGPLHRALHISDTKFRAPWHLDASGNWYFLTNEWMQLINLSLVQQKRAHIRAKNRALQRPQVKRSDKDRVIWSDRGHLDALISCSSIWNPKRFWGSLAFHLL